MSIKEYILFNRVFLLVSLLLTIVGCFFSESGELTCMHLKMTGESCPSCGLTRDFKSFLMLDFSNSINKASLGVFLFGMIQFIYRLAISVMGNKLIRINERKVIIADAVITFLLIIIVFLPFWM